MSRLRELAEFAERYGPYSVSGEAQAETWRLLADAKDALARRVEDCGCGDEDDEYECVWCHEDRPLLARIEELEGKA